MIGELKTWLESVAERRGRLVAIVAGVIAALLIGASVILGFDVGELWREIQPWINTPTPAPTPDPGIWILLDPGVWFLWPF